MRPQDASLLGELFEHGLSPAARRQRFHAAVRCLSPVQLAWLANADFRCHAAFIVTRQAGGLEHAVAEGCWVRSGGTADAEFAMSVADAWQHQGIGQHLLHTLVCTARAQGIGSLQGDVLAGNLAMQALAGSQQFDCKPHPDDDHLLRATLALAPQPVLSAAWFH
ncbi:MAG: GNAT family N-acetyltransferase [Aquabacterium sp.]|nr:GNAT family N-acetyltransferase [Aquabacterium sp.]